jgi:hypothetical protein
VSGAALARMAQWAQVHALIFTPAMSSRLDQLRWLIE